MQRLREVIPMLKGMELLLGEMDHTQKVWTRLHQAHIRTLKEDLLLPPVATPTLKVIFPLLQAVTPMQKDMGQ
jgi:hypothetical protein